MADTTALRNGLTIEFDGKLFTVVEFQHVKPGKGGAFIRTKLKNLETGKVIDKTFRSGEEIIVIRLERRQMQYLYNDGELYYFMDTESYEQLPVNKHTIENELKFLKEDMIITALLINNGKEMLGIELPFHIKLKVIETDPGLKGDTASGGTKPAKLETGAIIQVPLFIEIGEIIRVDIRTESYIERAKK